MGSCVSVNDGGGGEEAAVSGSVNEEPRVTGVHQFTIRQYSTIKGKGVGKSVLSRNFTVAGRSWFIRFYPDGYNGTTADHVAFFLQSLHRPRFGSAYNVEFSFTLLNPNIVADADAGGAVVHNVRCEHPCRFDNHHSSWGIRKYIPREQLEGAALGAIHDDSLTVRCTVHVIQRRRSRRAGPRPAARVGIQVPPSCHAKNAMHFLLSGDAPFDLEIHVGDTTFRAHRLVLAGQSPYFRTLLYGGGSEASSPRITIHERSPEAFGAVLHYIYHDSLPKEATKRQGRKAAAMARELFEAADMYAMERLKLICANTLSRFVNDDTASSIMELGRVHSCDALTKTCQNYMIRRRISTITPLAC
uniref:BTB domain-containing protein n=1 Tax=Oryza brachyantha TaxID=4533 RepID=J3M295_ORYBR